MRRRRPKTPNHASRPLQHLGVDDVSGCTGGESDDLVEDIGELKLVLIAGDIADVRGTHNIVHVEQRIVAVSQWLVLVNINGGHAGSPGSQSCHRGPGFHQPSSAAVDKQGARLHPCEILSVDYATCRVDKSHVQRQDVGGAEELLLVCCDRVAVVLGPL